MFKQILYHPDEAQVITTGSDRKIAYWDTFDGQQIRNIEASEAEINALAFMYCDLEGSHWVAIRTTSSPAARTRCSCCGSTTRPSATTREKDMPDTSARFGRIVT